MKDQTTFTSSRRFVLLLIGEAFSGKTTLAMSFPHPGVVDADNKIGNAVLYHQHRNPGFEFRYNVPDLNADGTECDPDLRWPRYLACCDEMLADPWVETVITDSSTRIARYLADWLISQPSSIKPPLIGGMKIMSQNHWDPFATLFQRHIARLQTCGKNVIVTAHIRTDKDEMQGRLVFRAAVPGSTGEQIGKLFPNFWRCVAKPVPIDATYPRGVKFLVQTAPDTQLMLGTELPTLPPEFEFSYATFATHWQKGVKPC